MKRLLSLAAAWLCAGAVCAEPIVLRVDATDLDHKVLRVQQTLPVQPGALTLMFPRWLPGQHGPGNSANRLAGLRINAGGAPLAWQRDGADPHRFRVEVPPGASRLELEFQQLMPLSSGGYDGIMQRNFVQLQWPSVLLYPADQAPARIEVQAQLQLPGTWKQASALRASGVAGARVDYEPVSLETLVDSPVFAAPFLASHELLPGVRLNLLSDSAAETRATEAQIDAHRRLVQQADRLFGARHFDRYDFLVTIGEGLNYNGLEHLRSSENIFKRGYLSNWDKSAAQRDLIPHEFAHSWNGKFRRPRELLAPDFNTPTRNSLLWVYEGLTEYWGYVLAARSGIIGADDLRDRLGRWARNLELSPGLRWRSVQDTTIDPIMTLRSQSLDWRSWQLQENYYEEGALIWLAIDVQLRELSGGRRSLDDFARAFFGVQPGAMEPLPYDFGDVIAALEQLQPHDWTGFVRRRLDTLDPQLLASGIERSGWRLAYAEQQTPQGRNREEFWEYADFAASLGFNVGKEGKLSDVVWDSPAFRSGLTSGLALLAVNRKAYKAEELAEALRAKAPVELLLKEDDTYRLVTPDYAGGPRYSKLERIEGSTDWLAQIIAPR